MSDLLKEPATPAQAPELGGKKSSSAAPIVITLVIIFVGLPILIVIVAMIFFFANFDKFVEMANHAIDAVSPLTSDYYSMDDARIKAASTIYTLSNDTRLRASGLAKVDCENLAILSDELDDRQISSSFCDAEEIKIGSDYEKNSVVHIYLSDGDDCAEYQFYGNFSKLLSSEKKSKNTCSDLYTVKIVDTNEKTTSIKDLKEYHYDEKQGININIR